METYDLKLATAGNFRNRAAETQIFFESEIPVRAEVIEVIDLSNHLNLERAPFSVMFLTRDNLHTYPQNTYTLLHPTHGEMQVFLVPVGQDNQGTRYEAVFS